MATNTVINPNVGFKIGPQSAVDRMITAGTGAVNGSFYLTSDTHRLYIGTETGSLEAVNEGVTTVTYISELPTTNLEAYIGRFYYVSDPNILCVYNGKAWAQINTDTFVSEIDFKATETTANEEVTIQEIVSNSNGSAVTSTAKDSFSVKGTNGIKVNKGAGDAQIVLEGDTYEISTANGDAENEVKIKLTSEKTDNDTEIVIESETYGNDASNALQVTQNGNKVTLKARDTVNSSLSFDALAQGFKVSVTDSYGKQVSDTLAPKIKYGNGGGSVVDFSNGVATLSVYTIDEINETMRVLNAMHYRGTLGPGGTAGISIIKDASGEAILDENNNPIKISIGDTFLIVGNTLMYNGDPLSANTLLIARGTEGSDASKPDEYGYITRATLTFDVVASTVDTDTTYMLQSSDYSEGDAQGATTKLMASTGPVHGALTVATIPTKNGDVGLKLTRTVQKSASGICQDVWVVEHDTIDFTPVHDKKADVNATTGLILDGTANKMSQQVAGNDNTNPEKAIVVPAVTQIQYDKSGHVIGLTTEDFVIRDTNARLNAVQQTSTAYNSSSDATKFVGVLDTTVSLMYSTGAIGKKTDQAIFASNSLQIKATEEKTTDGGTTSAHGLQIDMVWGTFQ